MTYRSVEVSLIKACYKGKVNHRAKIYLNSRESIIIIKIYWVLSILNLQFIMLINNKYKSNNLINLRLFMKKDEVWRFSKWVCFMLLFKLGLAKQANQLNLVGTVTLYFGATWLKPIQVLHFLCYQKQIYPFIIHNEYLLPNILKCNLLHSYDCQVSISRSYLIYLNTFEPCSAGGSFIVFLCSISYIYVMTEVGAQYKIDFWICVRIIGTKIQQQK